MQIGAIGNPGHETTLPLSFIIGCHAFTIEGPWFLTAEEQDVKIDLRILTLDLNLLVNIDNTNHLIHPGDIPYVKNILHRFERGEFMEYDFRIIAPQGIIKPLHGSGKLIHTLSNANVIEDLDHLQDEDDLHLKVYKYAEQVANIGSWTWNLQSDTLFFSENLYRLLGESPYGIPVDWQVFARYVHEQDRAMVIKVALQMKQQRHSLDVEFRLLNAQGELRYVNMKGEYFVTAKQKGYFIGTVLDITDSKQVNLLLKDTNELLQSVFDATTSGIAVFKTIRNSDNKIEDFEYLLADLQAEQFAGRKNLTGKRLTAVLPLLVQSKMINRFIRIVEDKDGYDDFEQQLPLRGQQLWFRISCVKFHDGLVVTTEDITARKKSEEEFQKEHYRFTEAQAIAHFGVFEWRPATDTFIWSDEMYRIHGLAPQSEVITRERFLRLIHPDDESLLNKLLIRSGSQALFQSIVHRIILSNGETRYLQRYFESFVNELDQVTHVSGIVQDVTERKRDELKIQQTTDLLKGIIDAPNNRIIVFKAKRNDEGEIVDFIFRLISKSTQQFYNGRTYVGDELSRAFPETFLSQFAAMKKVVESGVSHVEEQYSSNDRFNHWFKIIDVKFDDGIVRVWEDISERKRTEMEVRESKVLLQSVFNTSLMSMSLLEAVRDEHGAVLDFRIKLTNSALEREVNRTDLIGKFYVKEFPGVKKMGLFDLMLRVLETGIQEGMEYFYPYDGFNKWFSCMFVKKDDGLVATNLDISERKQSEELLIENKNLLQSVFDASNDSIVVQRSVREGQRIVDFEIAAANEKAKAHFGQPHIIGKKTSVAFAEWMSEEMMEKFIGVADTGSPEQFEIQLGAGTSKGFYFVRLLKLGDGVVFTCEDITQRKEAEQELTKNYEILQQAEEVAQMGSWEYITNTDTLYWSEGMYRLFALPPSLKVSPETYVRFAITQDKSISQDIVHSFRHEQQPFETNLRILINGVIKILKIRGTPLKNEKGNVERIIGVDLDITSLQKSRHTLAELNAVLQQKNQELQSKNEELSHLAFITSHDLREPLRKIRTYGSLLLEKEPSLTPLGKKNAERILSAAGRMQTLFDNILSFSQISYSPGTTFEKVDLNKIVEQVIHELWPLISKAGAMIDYPILPTIEGNEVQLGLLFSNLLSNAIKFQPAGHAPKIWINIKTLVDEHAKPAHLNPLVDYVLIEVKDNGLGFEDAYASRIFNLFQRLHLQENFQGTGLGLAICRKIMENHKGSITAKGNAGRGATFCCYFPLPKMILNN